MTKKVLSVIKALEGSIEKIGVDKTIKKLNTSDDSKSTSLSDYIIQIVCDEFNLKANKLHLSGKSSTQKKASHILSHLLYFNAWWTQSEIGDLLGRSKASVNRYISNINYLSESVQEEKEFKESILHLEEKIKNFKNNLY